MGESKLMCHMNREHEGELEVTPGSQDWVGPGLSSSHLGQDLCEHCGNIVSERAN